MVGHGEQFPTGAYTSSLRASDNPESEYRDAPRTLGSHQVVYPPKISSRPPPVQSQFPGKPNMRIPGAPASNADTSEYQAALTPAPSSRPKPTGAHASVPGAATKHMGVPPGREGGQEMGPPGKMGPPGARDGGWKGGVFRNAYGVEVPSITAYSGAPGTVRADDGVPDTPTTRNSTSKSKNLKSDIDQQLGKETKNRSTNQKAKGEELPQQSLADSGSMSPRDVQQALLFYTDQEWISYQRTHGGNADMEAFLRDCWLPASATAKTDVRERYRIDSQMVMDSLSEVMKEYHTPTLLHLICGQAKWKVVKVLDKPSGKYRIKANPGVVRFTGLEQVNATFEKRGELVRYLMRGHHTLYKRLPLSSQEVPPPLIYALDKFKHLPIGSNPFLQLFVSEDPEESARQLDPFTQQGGEAQEEEEEPVDMDEGEEEEGEESIEPSLSGDAVSQVESQSVPDPGWIHELLPRICSADAAGLDCVIKLFPKLSKDRLALQSKEGNTVLHLAARYKYACDESKEARGKLIQVIRELVAKYPEAVGVLNKDGESPYLHRIKTYQTKEGVSSDILPDDPITFYLKQLCISRNEPGKTLKLLYAMNDEKREQEPRFYLNLSGTTYYKKQFSRTRVESLLETLSLDNILKFVKIVPFTVLDDDTDAELDDHDSTGLKETQFDGIDSSAALAHREDGPPNNCEMVFDYLRNAAKVQAIYEVAVEESNIEDKKYPPHTDDAIAQCLVAPFSDHILTWDWQKIDICSELLRKVAPNVETLYLYTSGSNAILRSWSSTEGLIELPNLKKVYLTVCKAHVLETTKAIRQSIKNFKERLLRLSQLHFESGRRTCMIVIEDKDIDDDCLNEIDEQSRALMNSLGADNGSFAVEKQEAPEILQVPAWLKKMDAYTNYIINCPDDIKNPIKVAVLDDGFDMISNEYTEPGSIIFKTMDSWNNNRAGGYPSNRRRTSKFLDRHPMVSYNSESGHGTKMVKLIQKLCPKAKLYVARLSNVNRGPTCASAAEAIEWAIRCEVDIISMSWSIQTSPSSVARPPLDELRLKAAIDKAKNANILMFGAAADEGNNGATDPVIYPAAAAGVFCIVAADSYGQLKPTVGAEGSGKNAYAFPSEEVKDGKDHGSSVATALAAGFTALLLHSAEISGWANSEGAELRLLRNHENMARVFNGLLVPGTRYVGVTYSIPDYVSKGDWDNTGKKALRGLMRKILSSAV